MERLEFQTESKRLLNLMINSIYTNKDIFLRELISNASDATDKLNYYHINNASQELDLTREILISYNRENRTVIVKDFGIGMTKEELISNLGTIAKSGTVDFVESLSKEDDQDQIGQFGVGFYSSFMVSSKVSLVTKSPKSNKAYLFESDGISDYSVTEIESDIINGTEITLYLREDHEDFSYSKYLEDYVITDLVKKYSDFIKYPIKLELTNISEEDDEVEVREFEVINSLKPIWKKATDEITEEEINEFYKKTYLQLTEPFHTIKYNVEGNLEYHALLFIPQEFNELKILKDEIGLDLYTKGVFIKANTKELIPEYLGFIKGVIDSSDLSLNISREILQETKSLYKIRDNVEKKIVKELIKLKESDFDKYVKFYQSFGNNIKLGVYDNYAAKKDLLEDLLIFKSHKLGKYITLKEYVENFRAGQNEIFYLNSMDESHAKLKRLDDLGYDTLIFTNQIDEFVVKAMRKYQEYEFKNITGGDLSLDSESEKQELKKESEQSVSFLDKVKEVSPSISKVLLTNDLVDSAYVLESGELSFEMEKVYRLQGQDFLKAERILKFNPKHELYQKLKLKHDEGLDITDDIFLLYNQALVLNGLEPESKTKFNNLLVKLLLESK